MRARWAKLLRYLPQTVAASPSMAGLAVTISGLLKTSRISQPISEARQIHWRRCCEVTSSRWITARVAFRSRYSFRGIPDQRSAAIPFERQRILAWIDVANRDYH